MKSLYAIIVKDKKSQNSEVYCLNKKIICSEDSKRLKRFYNFMHSYKEEEIKIVDIQPFIEDRFISKRKLSNVNLHDEFVDMFEYTPDLADYY